MQRRFFLGVVVTILVAFSSFGLRAETSKIVLVLNSGSEHRAVLHDAEGEKATILLHQFGATAGSWMPLAQALQEAGVASIALTILSSHGVNAAAKRLAEMGKTEITLIGASMGGGTVINTLAEGTPERVIKAIFLATADKGPVLSPSIKKLHVVAREDVFRKSAYSAFETAAEPKRIIEYNGNAHAQDLFSTEHADDLIMQILNFINEK